MCHFDAQGISAWFHSIAFPAAILPLSVYNFCLNSSFPILKKWTKLEKGWRKILFSSDIFFYFPLVVLSFPLPLLISLMISWIQMEPKQDVLPLNGVLQSMLLLIWWCSLLGRFNGDIPCQEWILPSFWYVPRLPSVCQHHFPVGRLTLLTAKSYQQT